MGKFKATKIKSIEQIQTIVTEGYRDFDKKVNKALRDIQNKKGGEILYIVPQIGWRFNCEPQHESSFAATIVYYIDVDFPAEEKEK